MLTVIGVLLLIIATVSLVLSKIGKQNALDNAPIREKNSSGQFRMQETKPEFNFPAFLKPIILYPIGVLVFLLGIANPIGHNTYGYRQVVENPITGNTTVQFEQGWYIKGFFANTTTYPDVNTVMYSDKEIDAEDISSMNPSLEIRFSDAAKAQAEATIKFRLPNSAEEMLLIHRDNRNSAKLVETVLEKFAGECINYAAQLMESETHYSGGKSKMAEDFQTQLEEGQYIIITKAEYIKDEVSNTSRKITKTDVRRDENDIPIRKKSNLTQYGISIVSATIDNIDYIELIDEKLKAKIEASTRESIAKQEAITAEQEAITALRKGEQLLAETRAREESDKLEAVIRAEKEAAVAGENLKRDELNAKAKLAIKRAEAEGDKLKVIAGLSPLEKATIQKETAIGVAKALAGPQGIVFPRIVAGGGGSNGSSGALQTLELKMLNDLANDMAKTSNKKN
jgi:regulator of protease activity HflC (stomatin/prohibitin superfamily)